MIRHSQTSYFTVFFKLVANSSPATSSILWIAETLNLSVFPLFFCLLGVRVETCKIFTLVYTLLKMCKNIDFERLRCKHTYTKH